MGIPGGCAGRLKLEAGTFRTRMKMLEPAWKIERKARLRSAFKTATGLAGLEAIPAKWRQQLPIYVGGQIGLIDCAPTIGTACAYSQYRDRLVTADHFGFS
ncbi:hypothetical protein [Pararhizobium sp. DWP1-1-3]|uniref:hypothetical protein n=1 Tax=Pararhizobium sp. DWP1-1-3 TaxID=2804652 RepID=UPI003CF66204